MQVHFRQSTQTLFQKNKIFKKEYSCLNHDNLLGLFRGMVLSVIKTLL